MPILPGLGHFIKDPNCKSSGRNSEIPNQATAGRIGMPCRNHKPKIETFHLKPTDKIIHRVHCAPNSQGQIDHPHHGSPQLLVAAARKPTKATGCSGSPSAPQAQRAIKAKQVMYFMPKPPPNVQFEPELARVQFHHRTRETQRSFQRQALQTHH